MEMRFLKSMKRHYLLEGYRVYSKYFSELEAAPPDWKGGLADLIAEKDGRRIAVFRVHDEHLRDPKVLSRWRQASENPDTTLKLFAARREQLRALKRILQENGIPARLAEVRRGQQRSSRWHTRRVSLKLAAFLLLLSAAIALWYLALWVYDREAPLYYEPRDLERQAEEWKEKSEGE